MEIQAPGNPALVERVVALLVGGPAVPAGSSQEPDGDRRATQDGYLPVRLAQPGEFSARAYLHGKLTLEQAEGVAATIAAANAEQLGAARRLLDGETGRLYQQWCDELANLAALVEAGIDFTDQEDVVPIAPAALAGRLDALRAALDAHAGGPRERPDAEPLVALAGRPNAGKSTLFNALLGRTRAAVSADAGTTRDAIVEPMDLAADAPGAGLVRLADIAGLTDAPPGAGVAGEIDRAMQAVARTTLGDADVVLWCDPSGLFEAAPPTRGQLIRVRTFADRPVPRDESDISVCAVDGWNLPALRTLIATTAGVSRAAGVAALLPRHRAALEAACVAVGDTLSAIKTKAPRLDSPEVVAHGLRTALNALGELAGRVHPDDVIGRVFATFCVGK